MKSTRRKFLRNASLGVAGALTAPYILPARHAGFAPSDQLNIGLIGCRNRGFHVLTQHLRAGGVNCVALCDVDENVLREKKEVLAKDFNQQVETDLDFRRLLERKDIDAVIIGTPDHWHCLPAVYACQEGKDVYVEKPMANSIEECNQMVKAARYYNRIFQVGQQQRSSEVWRGAMDYMKAGNLGKVRQANIWAHFNYGLGPARQPDAAVPEGVDYNNWLGPAPDRPFNPARFHGSWRFFWDYGGGLMTDWGVHLIDMALWVHDIVEPPKTTLAYGSQLADPGRIRETHDIMSVVYPFDDYIIQWEHSAGVQKGPYDRLYGIAFIGERGTLVADREGWEVFPEWDNAKKAYKIPAVELQKGRNGHSLHPVNFIESIKNRTEPACTVEMGRAVALAAHFANIAARTGAYRLDWDDAKNKFTNHKPANQYIKPEYRKPWKLPAL
jgi:predicted dehydrogenase